MNAKYTLLFVTLLLASAGVYIGLDPLFSQWFQIFVIPIFVSFLLTAWIVLTTYDTVRQLEDRVAELERRLKVESHKRDVVEHLPEFENLNL